MSEFMASLSGDRPLFHIDANLATPDIIICPNGSEIEGIVMQVVEDFIER